MDNSNIRPETKLTFIIPTIGRTTLTDTLNTLKNQSNSNWKAIIIFDGIEPTLSVDDERVKIIKKNKLRKSRNSAGIVRNFGINLVETEWVAFLDDDDAVKNSYVETFYNELLIDNNDVIIFRMLRHNGAILPPPNCDNFNPCQVGISFAVKKKIFDEGIFFKSAGIEDFFFLQACRRKGYKIMISPYLLYFVRNYKSETYTNEIFNRVFINK
jgi:glycosyltransferase involved in cell wall biosynthesis